MSTGGTVAIVIGAVLALAIAVGAYLYLNRPPENPYITPPRHYDLDRLIRQAGQISAMVAGV